MSPQQQVGVDPRLDRLQAQSPRAVASLRGRTARRANSASAVTVPQRERLRERRAGLLGSIIGERRATLAQQALEHLQIELPRLDAKHIAAGDASPADPRRPSPPNALRKPPDVHLQALRRRRRRSLAPQLVDQTVGGHHLAWRATAGSPITPDARGQRRAPPPRRRPRRPNHREAQTASDAPSNVETHRTTR